MAQENDIRRQVDSYTYPPSHTQLKICPQCGKETNNYSEPIRLLDGRMGKQLCSCGFYIRRDV